IVNLGLVYGVHLDEDGKAGVEMTLTSMGCPMGPQIVEQVETALGELPEVKETEVNIVWNPPWGKDKKSRYAKIALGVSSDNIRRAPAFARAFLMQNSRIQRPGNFIHTKI